MLQCGTGQSSGVSQPKRVLQSRCRAGAEQATIKLRPADVLQPAAHWHNSKPSMYCLAALSPPLHSIDALQVQVMPIFESGRGAGHPRPDGVPHLHGTVTHPAWPRLEPGVGQLYRPSLNSPM